ncbi:hypothetical protein VCRA2110O318_80029 [Vibrio crassostreae]|nr:hypothetical protein VCRA2117O328_90029 [Vibrio crassostreae]CAK2358505.1 hypothetical protein VCRA2110O318_80029 [Vibrio crassostreae]CAK2436228.1 hypothetical protein VCRA2110O319_10199 [Vibrio crassostreae]CAK3040665.1 hypothetical protein VCRA217O317_80197 [Vibrio crassostreae]
MLWALPGLIQRISYTYTYFTHHAVSEAQSHLTPLYSQQL